MFLRHNFLKKYFLENPCYKFCFRLFACCCLKNVINQVNLLSFWESSVFGPLIYRMWLSVEPDKEMLNRTHLAKKKRAREMIT